MKQTTENIVSNDNGLKKHNNEILFDFFQNNNVMKIMAFFLYNDPAQFYTKKAISLGTGIPFYNIDRYVLEMRKSKYNILIHSHTVFENRANNVSIYKLNTNLKLVKLLRQLIKELENIPN